MLVLIQYIFWFYTLAPLEIIRIAKNYIIATWHKFYIVNHLKTLFLPWHRQEAKIEPKSLSDKILLATAGKIADLFLIFVAVIVRLTVVIFGLIAEVFVFLLFVSIFVLWILWPIILIYFLISGLINIQDITGLIYLIIALIISAATLKIFYTSYYVKSRLLTLVLEPNRQKLFSYEAAKIIKNSVSMEDLVKQISYNKNLKFIFRRINVENDYLYKALKSQDAASSVKPDDIFIHAAAIGELHGHDEIKLEDIFIAISSADPFMKAWFQINIKPEDIDDLGQWSEAIRYRAKKRHKFWDLENLLRAKPVGQTWAYGYTPLLNEFSQSILFTGEFIKSIVLVGRQKEIDEIERVLSKKGENNVLLVGEPGVGKESIIKGFASLVESGKTLPSIDYKRVLKLNIPLLVSRFKTIPDIQSGLIKILNEAQRAGNMILVIDDFHNFVGASELGIGKIDIAEIIIPYLESSRFQLIATTDPLNFHKYIENRPVLIKVFSQIDIAEPSIKSTMIIVEESAIQVEKETDIFFTFQAIKNIIYLADKYIHTMPFPEKALDLLNEAATFIKNQKRNIVLGEDIEKLVSQIAKVPIGIGSEYEKNLLLNLEDVMHQSLINQEEAVKVVAQALRRVRTGLTGRHKPVGSFLFIGPTGVGKTETAKVLAKQYFGSSENIIRFDMSEYQDIQSISRFIGSIEKNEPGQFVSKVRDHPSFLILLDEIEKADKSILNLFLTVFDEGYINDVYGRKISLEQNIIIATSNAGAEMIREIVQQNIDPQTQKEKIVDYLLKNNYFTPEFLNRFDDIAIYHTLSKENLIKVAEIMLSNLKDRLLSESYIFEINDEIKEYIVEKGFDPQFGARPMKRVIQDKIEEPISKMILNGQLKKGEKFTLPKEFLN